ncbi:MAG: D-alanine--D-alanine ligase, partial [Bosea sp. (in: a-proteobacteria)]|nr:D-alanine--D-alanine ligase [Bosea sp. (in: a-proteobacteria)]
MNRKTRVAVLYGGKSGEHEVSLKSAASVLRYLDRERFEPVPVSIDKEGRWQCHDLRRIEAANTESLPIPSESPAIRFEPLADGRTAILPSAADAAAIAPVDVVFPVIHGPLCEDGSLQGLLELA